MGVVSASQDLNDTVTQADDCLNQTTDEIQAADGSDSLQVADDDDELSEDGEFLDVSEAYDCLNNFRCEGGVWQWNDDDTTKTYFNTNDTVWLYPIQRDAELEETAKIRAKELYQLFSHTRPDGTLCFTAFPENLTSWGENIAMGQVSCDEVTEDWKETNDPYDGQGHRRNMLDPGFNRVGIAAYKIGGTIYWVQDFGCRYDPKPVENALFYMENNSNSPYFTVQLPVYATGDFIVKLNGREVIRKSVVGGKANVTVYGLNSGTYDVELVYGGDSNYMSVSETGTINALGDATTSASFTYLNTVIKVGGDNIKLEKDYAFDNAADSDFKNGIIIPEPITIDGQGHTIDGQGLSRIFILHKGSKLKNIRMVNASANYGGAVLSYGTIVLENCTFANNYASMYGGVAYAVSQIHDYDSRFINNTARFNGGALFGEAAVIVSGSTFIDNHGMNMAGAIYAQGTLSTDNAFYANNTNLQVYSMMMIIGKGNNLEDDYARVFANATLNNGVVNLDEDLTATQTILISGNNTVINGNGHAINANGRDRIFFITGNNVTIRNITLTGGYGVYDGGAIFCRASDISIIDSTFTGNRAETGAAVSARGNVFVSSSRFTDNTADAGGAIFTDGGNVTVIDSVFENDDAVTFGAGAIYCQAMINVTNSVFMGCDGPSYGVMFTNGKKFGKVYITDSTFINNTADNNGSVLLAYLGADISGSVFENNSAGGDGGAIYSWGDVSIVSSNFTGNTAGNNGGVVYHHGGNTSIANSNFRDNSAGNTAGAVYGKNIKVINSNFTDNSAGSSNTFTGKVTGENSTVIENGADVTSAYIAGKASSSVNVVVANATYPGSVSVSVSVENATVVSYVVKTVGGKVVVGETVLSDLSNPLKLDLDVGNYIITVTNNESDNIIGSYDSASFTVFKASGNQSGSGNGTDGGSSTGDQGDSSSESKMLVKKATKITATKKTFKAKVKTKKYTVTIKSGKKAVAKVRLVLKIKGKTFKATTNKKGKATFKIKLKKKGTFTAKITFAGNKNYKKSSKSVKIKFK